MKRKTKVAMVFIAAISSIIMASSSTMAANVTVNGNNMMINSNTTSASLDTAPGIGTSTTSGIGFGTITIDMANATNSITGTDYIRVDDNRGKNAGWNVTVSATDFTATGITDESVVGTLSVAIPASAVLTVTPQNPTALFSTELSDVTAQNTAGIPVTSGAGVKVLSAAKGYGQGVYKQQLDYSVTMPNYLPATAVVTATNPASEFIAANRTPGAKIGLFEGVYSSTVSYNISTGP